MCVRAYVPACVCSCVSMCVCVCVIASYFSKVLVYIGQAGLFCIQIYSKFSNPGIFCYRIISFIGMVFCTGIYSHRHNYRHIMSALSLVFIIISFKDTFVFK